MYSPQTLIISSPIYAKDRDCGYCHNKKQGSYSLDSWRQAYSKGEIESPHSTTMGMSVENVSLKDYEKMCNMGFRRSGTFLYKPDLLRNCCLLYTIRTPVGTVKLDKDQKKCVRRFIKNFAGPNYKRKFDDDLVELQRFELELDRKKFYSVLDKPTFTTEKFNLYKKYQVEVHKDNPDKLTARSFKRFLCENPFHEATNEGHVHELYYIDEELLAILVLDILPQGISSVYFIWDPKYHKLGLGKLSSLRELNLCAKLNKDYYYLGYYVPDCQKMNYKKKLGGELLDVSKYEYFKFEDLDKIVDETDLFIVGDQERKELRIEEIGDRFRCAQLHERHSIAESIYGYESAYFKEADSIKSTIPSQDTFPSVVPGLIPWYEVKENLPTIKKLKTEIYDPTRGISPWRYGKDTEYDEAVLSLVRLLGWGLIEGSVIIIY